MESVQIESAVVNSSDEALDMWAFVEVMGHSKIAGRLTTRKLGTSVMLQVDVLKPDGSGSWYSKLYAPGSLFSITPCSEEFCKSWSKESEKYGAKPIPYIEAQRQLPAPTDPTRLDDFFDFCVSNGLPHPEEMSHEDLRDALKLYASRNERRSDDEEDDDRALF